MPIRLVTPADAEAIQAILRSTIEDSAITFYEEVPTVEQMRDKIVSAPPTHPWLVLEQRGTVVGHASASRYRSSEGTRWGVETSIGLAEDARGKGLGTSLYGALLEGLQLLGFCNAYAGITLPNLASVRLHERLGFEAVGVYRRTGYKLGRWHDSLWMQRALGPRDAAPGALRPATDLTTDPELRATFAHVTDRA